MPDQPVSGKSTANGCWTQHGVARQVVRTGSIFYHPINKAGEAFSLRLRSSSGELFTAETHWGPGDSERKTLATDVLKGTSFTIDSRGSDGKTDFNGTIKLP